MNSQINTSNTLLTIEQTCQTLSISRSHFYCLVRSGAIRTIPLGKRCRRVPVAEIERFIQNGLEGGDR